MQRYRVCVPTSAPTYVTLPKNAVCNYYFRMPRLKGYSVHEVITMLENDENFWEANVYICPPTDPNCSDGDSADEELGTIDNLSRNQLAAEGEATVLRGPHERERIGGYEETEDTLEDTSEVTTSSAGGELVVSAGPSHAATDSSSPVSTHLPRVSKRRSSSSKSVASTKADRSAKSATSPANKVNSGPSTRASTSSSAGTPDPESTPSNHSPAVATDVKFALCITCATELSAWLSAVHSVTEKQRRSECNPTSVQTASTIFWSQVEHNVVVVSAG